MVARNGGAGGTALGDDGGSKSACIGAGGSMTPGRDARLAATAKRLALLDPDASTRGPGGGTAERLEASGAIALVKTKAS